jgi:hypothetical protein
MAGELSSPEYAAARDRIESLGGTIESVQQILSLLAELPSLRAKFSDEYVVLGPDGPITWVNHESLTWALGESIRQALRRRPKLRKDPPLWLAIEGIGTDQSVGKGREPFVMLLGQYGDLDRVPVLLQLLDDPEVAGHALYALRLPAAPGAEGKTRELAASRRTWIRNEAKKYLERIAPPA